MNRIKKLKAARRAAASKLAHKIMREIEDINLNGTTEMMININLTKHEEFAQVVIDVLRKEGFVVQQVNEGDSVRISWG